MRKLFLGYAAVVLSLVCVNPSSAGDDHRHRGHNHGYYANGYWQGYNRGYDIHNRHSSRYGHFDYTPGHMHRHGNHYHYVPPHYDYHYRGRRYEATPTPWGWQLSPWSHRRD